MRKFLSGLTVLVLLATCPMACKKHESKDNPLSPSQATSTSTTVPSDTMTNTPTPAMTGTFTSTQTSTVSPTPTSSATPTGTATESVTSTETITDTIANTSTATPTQTVTNTATTTPTLTTTSTATYSTCAAAGLTTTAPATGGNGSTFFAVRVNIPVGSVVSKLQMFIKSYSSGSIQLGLYSDNAGYPGTRLAMTNSISSITTGLASWDVTSPISVTAGNYWVAYNCSGYAEFASDNSTTQKFTFITYGYSMPDTFPSGGPVYDGVFSLSAVYCTP